MIDCPLHIVQRGINGGACFFTNGDYIAYLRYLDTFSARFGCSVHAYCLMTNHVHLLITPHAAEACALMMKNLSQRYVQGLNHRLGRSGTLWEGRFHSSLVLSEGYVLNCYRYIELNPVRARLANAPGEYRWSSYRANAEPEAPRGFLRSHPVYDGLGADADQRARSYRALCSTDVSPPELEEIRKAIRVGCAIGSRRRNRGRPSALDEKNRDCPYF